VLISLNGTFLRLFDMIISTGFLALAMMADATATAPAAAAPTPIDPMEKVVCRRFTETGTLAKSKRVCLTKREWIAADEKGQKFAEDVVRDGNKGAIFQ
jgi:hypothetical protein